MSSHHPLSNRPSARVAALLLATVLAACGTAGSKRESAVAKLPADPNALVLGAEMALQRGQFLEGSQAYLRAAQNANDEELAEQATRVADEHHPGSVVLAAAEPGLELNATNQEARRNADQGADLPRIVIRPRQVQNQPAAPDSE